MADTSWDGKVEAVESWPTFAEIPQCAQKLCFTLRVPYNIMSKIRALSLMVEA